MKGYPTRIFPAHFGVCNVIGIKGGHFVLERRFYSLYCLKKRSYARRGLQVCADSYSFSPIEQVEVIAGSDNARLAYFHNHFCCAPHARYGTISGSIRQSLVLLMQFKISLEYKVRDG